MLKKDYDEKIGGKEGVEIKLQSGKTKLQGFKKGYFINRKIRGKSVVVNVQKDNKIVLEAGNCVDMKSRTQVWRYNKEKRTKEPIMV